jgi:argininosuccinate synthase
VRALNPDIGLIAPVREWDLTTREQEIEWAQEHGIAVPVTKASPYSIDDNLWGRTMECGILEDPWAEPPSDVFELSVDPEKAPDEPEYLSIGFEHGLPCSLNGQAMTFMAIIEKLNSIAGAHGYGRIDMIENRLIGVKSREIYETPAALSLIHAHKALEELVLERDLLRYKHVLEQDWANCVYDAKWFSPLKMALDAFMAATQEYVTGEVRCKLYKGSLRIVGRKSDYSLYDFDLATYGAKDSFDRDAAAHFIELYGLTTSVWARKQGAR